jgi:phenylalanine-4-hydroxylase
MQTSLALHSDTSASKASPAPSPPSLRGDYSRADAKMVVEQRWEDYSAQHHRLWRALFIRQSALLQGRACQAYISGLAKLGASEGVPHLGRASEKLFKATGWELSPAPGLIPEIDFFIALCERRFPVTVWLREPSEIDYIVEPDIFHDFFGHAPMLFDPVFADRMQAHGQEALRAGPVGATPLGRLYWRTVEFGLIGERDGARAYGAGLLSSGGELRRALSAQAIHEPFDLERVMSRPYAIDSYQPDYTLISSFEDLYQKTAPPLGPLYEKIARKEAASQSLQT